MAEETKYKTTQGEAVDPASALLALLERLKARADNAYIEMIGAARRDEALGWEIKVERGVFGRPEIERKMSHFQTHAKKCKPHKERPSISFDGCHVIECPKGCMIFDGENVAIEPIMQKWEDLNG